MIVDPLNQCICKLLLLSNICVINWVIIVLVVVRPAVEDEDAEVNHMDLIDVLEDEDDLPTHIGQFDFSAF